MSEQLLEEPYRFDFFQAVRLLGHVARRRGSDSSAPRPAPVGEDHAPASEIVRFRALPSHGFPPGDIASIKPPSAEQTGERRPGPPEMVVAFMGMTGPAGVLPQHYTQLVIDRIRRKDLALRDFLDLFNHRTVSLFYRAWEKYCFPIAYERAALTPGAGEDLLTRCLYCLVGLGTGGLRNRLELDDESFLYYSGHFAHRPRSAVSLELIVQEYFELPADVLQFQGQWLYLSREDQTCTPSAEYPDGRNNQLGLNVVIGERVWGIENKFRVRLGPVGYAQFRRFTPGGDRLRRLCQLVRMYAGGEYDFDVQPVLRRREVPPCRLGGKGTDPSQLGWNTWISSRPFEDDVDDAVFEDEGRPSR